MLEEQLRKLIDGWITDSGAAIHPHRHRNNGEQIVLSPDPSGLVAGCRPAAQTAEKGHRRRIVAAAETFAAAVRCHAAGYGCHEKSSAFPDDPAKYGCADP